MEVKLEDLIWILGVISFIPFPISLFGGYILYHWFSHLSSENVKCWIRRSKVITLILIIFLMGSKLSLIKIERTLSVILFCIFSIPFGFFLALSLWNLKAFQKHPMLRFIFFPLFIWWGMLLYLLLGVIAFYF